MAFFHTYLIENEQTPDNYLYENDEAALVAFLVQARLNRSAKGLRVPEDYIAPDELPDDKNVLRELKFVAGFVCFFVSKPSGYMIDMERFKDYYIPGFASDTAKQTQLAESLQKEFYTAKLEDLAKANSLGRFCDITKIPIVA